MSVIKCPVDGCEYSTPNQEAVIGAALLNAHATTHQAQRPVQAARVEKVKRPDKLSNLFSPSEEETLDEEKLMIERFSIVSQPDMSPLTTIIQDDSNNSDDE